MDTNIEKNKNDSLDSTWQYIAKSLQEKTNEAVYKLCFDNMRFVSLDDKKAVFSVPIPTSKTLIDARYFDTLKKSIKEVLTFCPENIDIIVEGDPSKTNSAEDQNTDVPAQNSPKPENKNIAYPFPEYTFENFVEGNSNEYARAAAINVADRNYNDKTRIETLINPFIIWGKSGLGKTHLMYAIANKAIEKHPDLKIQYVKAQDFSNQIVEALTSTKNIKQEILGKYRDVDMFLIDDIQFIEGKEATQTEFFHIFENLYERNKQIIITCDRPPKELNELTERLKTRFEAALIADIKAPDYELRVAILKTKAKQYNIELPEDVLEFLAQNIKENIRQLEGVVKKLSLTSIVTGQPISMQMVLQFTSDYLKESEPVSDTAERIVSVTSRIFKVDEKEIIGPSRIRNIKDARNAAMYIMRKITSMSLSEIGKIFDNRDSSTVHSNVDVVAELIKSDRVMDAKINEIIKEVERGQ